MVAMVVGKAVGFSWSVIEEWTCCSCAVVWVNISPNSTYCGVDGHNAYYCWNPYWKPVWANQVVSSLDEISPRQPYFKDSSTNVILHQ